MVIDILQISRDAREAKRHFNDVIDASVGMFIGENGFVGGLPVVFETLKSMPPELMIPYPSVDGGQPFKDNVFDWVFQQYGDLIKKNFSHFVCATPGGSGAVASVFHTLVPKKEKILVSDVRWQYDRFSEPAGVELEHYSLFEGEYFNLASFREKLINLCQVQQRIVIVMNDPCQNPSGYTLSLKEWDDLIAVLNEMTHNELVLLYDIAYIDYSCEPDQRVKSAKLINLKPHVHVMVTFSGSKTFGAYGLRLGALIGLSRDKDWLQKERTRVFELARGTWSCSPTPSIELLNKMMTPENKPQFLQGLAEARATIIKRGQLFLSQAREVGLPLIPYVNGFYVIVKCDNSHHAYETLAKKHIFAVPVDQGIRVALCSLRLKDIDGLPARMKQLLF